MKLKQYVVDAFTENVFHGNPAAVCVMNEWIADEVMQQIAMENNLSETAFTVKEGDMYNLRWFTPKCEVPLCGHATLATAFVILTIVEPSECVHFNTKSGELIVNYKEGMFEMDFPAYELKPIPVTDDMEKAIGVKPIEAFMGRDMLCILEKEEDVRAIQPNGELIGKLDGLLLNVTAAGKDKYDCVSRSFGPHCGIIEDPVCGSGHCHVLPYWFKQTGKDSLIAYQASPRGGILYARSSGDRIILGGHAVLYSTAEINF